MIEGKIIDYKFQLEGDKEDLQTLISGCEEASSHYINKGNGKSAEKFHKMTQALRKLQK